MRIAAIPDRLRRRVRALGLRNALHDLALNVINRVVRLQILKCMVLDTPSPALLSLDPRYRARFLEPDHLLSLAEDPRNDMSPAYVRAALEQGDECFGILDGEVLATSAWYMRKPFGWYTRRPTDELVLRFGDGYVYVNKGFTREEYRGQRLHSIARALAFEEYRRRGFRGFISVVISNNFASLRSNERMGNRQFGSLVIVRALGRTFVHASRGCRRLGVAFEHQPRVIVPSPEGVRTSPAEKAPSIPGS